ncbi:MAG: hypothetical protein VX589_01670 [Myxococcota bacterium]|nr:hypothetical protein [Myxococcota bacterium]
MPGFVLNLGLLRLSTLGSVSVVSTDWLAKLNEADFDVRVHWRTMPLLFEFVRPFDAVIIMTAARLIAYRSARGVLIIVAAATMPRIWSGDGRSGGWLCHSNQYAMGVWFSPTGPPALLIESHTLLSADR